ncbi:MAG: hypothetical protein ACYTGG_00270 [Planctomycetota bacterium]|jgi:hypothetical protein
MPVFLKRLWIRITADRRKFGMFSAVLVVGLLLWARIIVISNTPRTAIARDETPGRTSNPITDPAHAGATDKPGRPVREVQLDRAVQRDPFILSNAHFPRPTLVPDPVQETPKSDPQPTEDPEQIEAQHVARLQAFVDRLKLEAVIGGGPMAVISGSTYRLGDEVPESDMFEMRFKLVEIGQRSVILEWEGRRFELKMDSPGG